MQMDFLLSEEIFATAYFPLNQFFWGTLYNDITVFTCLFGLKIMAQNNHLYRLLFLRKILAYRNLDNLSGILSLRAGVAQIGLTLQIYEIHTNDHLNDFPR